MIFIIQRYQRLVRISVGLVFLLFQLDGVAQVNKLAVSEYASADAFPLAGLKSPISFYYDLKDAAVVGIAATAFASDLKAVTGEQLLLTQGGKISANYSIVAGTIGQSRFIDELAASKKITVNTIQNQWERFIIKVISETSAPSKKILVIAGSDRRGTAFGIFHLSRLMGVSPMVWWADVAPIKYKRLFVSGSYVSTVPSVQYRGIFINDEDWGLQPWAAKNMDTDIKDIGPKTYAKVFELMLRLKANYIWPAMHPCTKAFYYYKQNPKVADDYAIVVGGSHCEPMLRNNVCEWAETYQEEYGKKPGEWRYDVNRDEIYNYWDDRIKEAVQYESVFTVGMRGVHDGSMPGPPDPAQKVKLLETVIKDQRTILSGNFKKDASAVPQIFVPYKEVLSLYRRGLQLPDDVTIIWPDDNHGYIRQLPDKKEQQRSGGNGVYYHLSYWGAPQDYLWLSTISPSLIGYEMQKAYEQGARKLWVFNVGDIKPAELELQFAMDMAWDINQWNATAASDYTKSWAAETFGKNLSEEIAAVKNEFYLLAAAGKPEHMNSVQFNQAEQQERLDRYKALDLKARALNSKIPGYLKDAYFELVMYPVMGARLMNEKILYARKSFKYEHLATSNERNVQLAKQAYDSIRVITEKYNHLIAGGKWNGVMSWQPRKQPVFNMPLVYNESTLAKRDSLLGIYASAPVANLSLNIASAAGIKETPAMGLRKLKGLGIGGFALASYKKALPSSDTSEAYIEWTVPLEAGQYKVVVKCLPVFDVNNSKELRYRIEVNGNAGKTVNVHAEADSKAWKENVIRGYSAGESNHLTKDKMNTVRLYFKDAGVVFNSIEFYKQ